MNYLSGGFCGIWPNLRFSKKKRDNYFPYDVFCSLKFSPKLNINMFVLFCFRPLTWWFENITSGFILKLFSSLCFWLIEVLSMTIFAMFSRLASAEPWFWKESVKISRFYTYRCIIQRMHIRLSSSLGRTHDLD